MFAYFNWLTPSLRLRISSLWRERERKEGKSLRKAETAHAHTHAHHVKAATWHARKRQKPNGAQNETLGLLARKLNLRQKVQVFGAFRARIQKLQKMLKITYYITWNALNNPSFPKKKSHPKRGTPSLKTPGPGRLWRVFKKNLALFSQTNVSTLHHV